MNQEARVIKTWEDVIITMRTTPHRTHDQEEIHNAPKPHRHSAMANVPLKRSTRIFTNKPERATDPPTRHGTRPSTQWYFQFSVPDDRAHREPLSVDIDHFGSAKPPGPQLMRVIRPRITLYASPDQATHLNP